MNQMLRTIARSRILLRSLPQTLTSISQSSLSSTSRNISLPSILSLSSPYSQSSKQKYEDTDDSRLLNRDETKPPRLFVVQPRLRPDTLLQAKLEEALNLANSLEEQRDGFFDTELCDKELPQHVVVQNPAQRSAKARADKYFGMGTVDTVRCHLNAVESKGEVDAIFVNAILSAVQQRNLERAWGRPVLDRVGLIIEIFNAHANTKEGKLQAELAALMYKKSRLVRVRGDDGRYTFGSAGEAEVVSARGRGSGGRGFISGAGETELQLQRRRINERRKHLLLQIKEVRQTRALQRASRKRHGDSGRGLATVAVVGYTNAGKSTLVSTLSDTYLYSDDRLFATVDPRLRSVVLPSGQKVLVSDTVGFISDLPVQLVDAFSATLEEVVEADLLVHVLDSSAPNLEEHRSSVLQVLKQIGVSKDKLDNMIEVWNKIDLQDENMGCDGDVGSFTGEDDDAVSEVSTEETIDDEDNYEDDNVSELSPAIEESVDDEQSDHSDGWLQEDNQGAEDWKILTNQQSESFGNLTLAIGTDCQTQSTPHVKTSAVMGVGLQELLELIEEKLNTPKAVEKDISDRKWRPRFHEKDVAVQ